MSSWADHSASAQRALRRPRGQFRRTAEGYTKSIGCSQEILGEGVDAAPIADCDRPVVAVQVRAVRRLLVVLEPLHKRKQVCGRRIVM